MGLKKDCDLLSSLFTKTDTPDRVLRSITETILDVLEASCWSMTEGLRVLSYILLSSLSAMSETDEVLALFLYNVKIATPKPYLTPVASFYRPCRGGLQDVLNIKQSEQDARQVKCADFSKCERYLVAGIGRDITGMSKDTRENLGSFKGHDKDVTVVMFNSDASKISSGSEDENILVWDWQAKESPCLTFRAHTSSITDAATRFYV